MKAKRLKPGRIVNSSYNEADRRAAKRAGVPYDTPQYLNLPVGEIVEDKDCWRHCVGDDPAMVPADDDCTRTVTAYLGDSGRKDLVKKIRRLQHPDVRKQLGKSDLAWLEAMEEAHVGELTAATLQ